MVSGYKRNSDSSVDIETVAITGVDVEGQKATGLTRTRTELTIDCQYPVGGLHITPAIGEQWYLERFGAVWRLKSKIPFNDPTLLIERTQGQVKLGSGTGPVELSGTQVNLYGFLQLFTCESSSRPTDASEGACVFDTTLHKPIFFDGTNWVDALGTTV